MVMPLLGARAGVIFDMDGLMLDSERVARIAWQRFVLPLVQYEHSRHSGV